MTDLMIPERTVNRRATAVGIEGQQTSWFEGFTAAALDAFDKSGITAIIESSERAAYEDRYTVDDFGEMRLVPARPHTKLTPEQANAKYGIKGRLSFEVDTPEPVAKSIYEAKQREIERQTTWQRSSLGIGGHLTAGLVASVMDPVGVGLSFVPVVGQTRYAAMVARLGKVQARAAKGAIEGAAGAALLEPLILSNAMEKQADYTMVDSLMNLAFGTALGAGLHMGAGYLGDRMAARAAATPFQRTIDDLPRADQEAALRVAAAQVIEGRPVDVAPVLTASPEYRQMALVESPEFKAWFEGSQVAADGTPLPVYRGTPRGNAGGRFFTTNPALASGYAYSSFFRGGGEPTVHKAYLSMKNPLVIDALGKRNDNIPVPWQEWKPKVFGNLPKNAVSVDDALKYAIEHGHDGIIVKNVVDTADVQDRTKGDVYAVADEATQVRSAFDAVVEPLMFTRETGDAMVEAAIRGGQQDPGPQLTGTAEMNAAEAAAARAEVAKVQKTLDEQITEVEEEIVELEEFLPPDSKVGEGEDVRMKEADNFGKAWKAAASCLLRRA